jgi:hypothetical protein
MVVVVGDQWIARIRQGDFTTENAEGIEGVRQKSNGNYVLTRTTR